MRPLLVLVIAVFTIGCAKSHEVPGDGGPITREPSGGTATCTPGSTVMVGCAAGCGIGSCTGDPVLRVCAGSASVAACADGSAASLADVDDTGCGGLCPQTTVTCPSSGRLTIAHRPFGGGSYTCDWEAR